MFLKLLFFELRYKLKQPFAYIYWLLLFIQAIWYVVSTANSYFSDKSFTNAASVMYISLSGLGIIGLILTAITTSTALYRDIEHKLASVFYTSQIKEGTLFWSRWLGTFIYNCFIFTGYIVGMIVIPYTGADSAENFAPTPYFQILHGTILFLLPSIFALTSISYALTVFTKKASGAYFGIFIFMAMSVFAESTRGTALNKDLIMLLDPFGFSYIQDKTSSLSALEKNTFVLPVEPLLLIRIISWTSFSILLLLIARWRFSYQFFFNQTSGKKSKKIITDLKEDAVNTVAALPLVSLEHKTTNYILKLFRLSILEFKGVVRSIVFKLICIMFTMMFIGYNLIWTEQYYSLTPQLPLTYLMTSIRLPVGFMMVILLMIYAGEMFYKDRTANIWQITDALPVPTYVTLLSRLVAMAMLCFTITSLFIVAGIFSQVVRGYYNFEIPLYLYDCLISSWPKYVIAVCLAMFVASLCNNRYIGHITTIGVFIFLIIMHETNMVEQTRFLYMFTPEFDYSDINGHGNFVRGEFWFRLLWLSAACILVVLSLLFWNRGVLHPLFHRIKKSRSQFNLFSASFLLLFAIGFIACQNIIYKNVNVLNEFRNEDDERAFKANYEKKYKLYENYPQPKIIELDLKLDLNPDNRKADYTISLWLKNKTEKAIDTLHLEYKQFSTLNQISYNGTNLTAIKSDKDFRHLIFVLPKSLHPADSANLHCSLTLHYQGFTDHEAQEDLAFNGTFLSTDIIPHIGYDADRELIENKFRTENGLPPILSRLPEPNSPETISNNYIGNQSDRLKYNITVSVPAPHQIITGGKLIKEWESEGRNYKTFQSEGNGLYNFYIASANYSVQKFDYINKETKQKVSIQIYHHPTHAYNINYFKDAIFNMLDYGIQNFGVYPYSEIRVVEKTRYTDEINAYDNVIALPEDHGWTADSRRNSDVDYLNYVVCKLISQHWFMQSGIQNAKGYPVITKSLSGYIALSMFEEKYGDERLKGHLKKRIEDYFKGRGSETKTEPVLLFSDDADYVEEDKGSLSLFMLSKLMGQEKLNVLIKSYADTSAKIQTAPFLSPQLFYTMILSNCSDSLKSFCKDAFENRVIYDNSIISATQQNGYVTVKISCKKWEDKFGNGEQKEITRINEIIPIQLFDLKRNLIYSRYHWIKEQYSEIKIKTETPVETVGIDFYYQYLDINLSNNSIKISVIN
jgi:hypothetical protein